MTKKTLYTPMITAYFALLNANTDYAALELQEFRRYDGRIFMPEEPKDIPEGTLPCHAIDSIAYMEKPFASSVIFEGVTKLEGSLWVEARGDSGKQDCTDLEHVQAVVQEVLHSWKALTNGMGPAVKDYTIEFQDVVPLEGEREGIYAFWRADYELILIQQIEREASI